MSERAADESTSGREDGQRAHRGDKQAKPSPLNVSTAYLVNIFFRPALTIPWRAVGRRSDRRRQRFNGSRHRRRYCANFFDRQVRTLSISVISCRPTP